MAAAPSPALDYSHLLALSTPVGVYEHALGVVPRVEHGYCVDDVARALVVTVREASPSTEVAALAHTCLDFILAALRPSGLMHNRRDAEGRWTDGPSTDDHWGRAIWALGTAAAESSDLLISSRAFIGASTAMQQRSPWPRSMAYAVLGAARMLVVDREHAPSLALLRDAQHRTIAPRNDTFWPWPEDRLTYANAVIPEAMIATADALDDPELLRHGLQLLNWLVGEQMHDGHLSVVSSQGRARGAAKPAFAQQPIEVACLAEACRQAFVATHNQHWLAVIDRCLAWFEGSNDLGLPMHDPASGGGCDGLEADGVSINQGAESTLAWLATWQISRMPSLIAAR
ncbi:MAG: hypothetical protein PHU75_06615 [Candidatus Nanopelagicales bacterium]|nr:hypothetical protein [Candidatus Nanopelagicales bacterium]